uniref:Uncharacterized protein n=1 Tax=Oryza brachyantha TaxID=4533 RepID=J3M5Y8_ORYBR
MAPRVLYRRHGSTVELSKMIKDVVDLTVDGALRGIRKRVLTLEDIQPERIYSLRTTPLRRSKHQESHDLFELWEIKKRF